VDERTNDCGCELDSLVILIQIDSTDTDTLRVVWTRAATQQSGISSLSDTSCGTHPSRTVARITCCKANEFAYSTLLYRTTVESEPTGILPRWLQGQVRSGQVDLLTVSARCSSSCPPSSPRSRNKGQTI